MPVPVKWSDLSQTPTNNSPSGAETVGPLANDYFQAAFSFIRQLYDMGGLPNVPLNCNAQRITNVANGTALTDAVTLQQLNTTLGAPSGTRVVFQQSAAPTGWVMDTNAAYADCSVRFNNTGLSSGGSTPWSAWNFGGQFGVNGHQLSTAEMPSHSHGDNGHGHGVSDPGHGHGVNDPGHNHPFTSRQNILPQSGSSTGCWTGTAQDWTGVVGTGISIAASGCGIGIQTGYANLAAAGGNAAHGHTINTPQVKYADVIICIKS